VVNVGKTPRESNQPAGVRRRDMDRKVVIANSFRKYADYCRKEGLVPHKNIFVSTKHEHSICKLYGLLLKKEHVVILDAMPRQLREYLQYRVAACASW